MGMQRLKNRPAGQGRPVCVAPHADPLRLLYNLVLTWGIFLSSPVSLPMLLTSAKRRATFLQRLGLTACMASGDTGRSHASRPVWLHALSVGEVRSAIPLVKQWQGVFERERLVFSASTQTGYAVAQQEIAHEVDALLYYPYDLLFSVKRAIDRVSPGLMVLVETDIWPNFLLEMKHRNIPVLLVNAKLSKRSWRGYQHLGGLIRPVFDTLALVCTQTRADAERFHQLGVRPERLVVTGNIKFDQAAPPDEALRALRRQLNWPRKQPAIVAGSTHPGEETLIRDAWEELKRKTADLKLIVAPRDPARAADVRRIFTHAGHTAVLLSEILEADAGFRYDVMIVDIVGLLSRLYGLANVAVVGGSLVPAGGHNPLEPAAWSKPIVYGADMSDFDHIARMLVAGGGARQVSHRGALTATLQTLIHDTHQASMVGQNAYRVFQSNQGTVARTLAAIGNFREARQ